MRCDAETKQELHLRAVELRDDLWQVCDERKTQAESTRDAIANDLWVRDHCKIIEDLCIALLQAEVDRYGSASFLTTCTLSSGCLQVHAHKGHNYRLLH